MDIQENTSALEAVLAALGSSPQDNGTVEMIVCRPAKDERQVLEQGEVRLDVGLVGDSWLQRGSRHTPDGSANLEQQITLMNSRVITAIAGDRAHWPPAGDQIFVDFDLSAENLPVGQRIAIGTAVLEVSATPHNGCDKFTERYGHEAIRLVNSPEGRAARRRGINARVVQPGTFRVGDTVRKVGSVG